MWWRVLDFLVNVLFFSFLFSVSAGARGRQLTTGQVAPAGESGVVQAQAVFEESWPVTGRCRHRHSSGTLQHTSSEGPRHRHMSLARPGTPPRLEQKAQTKYTLEFFFEISTKRNPKQAEHSL